ncbi:MAG TPA: hypothetical protein PK736_02235 [Bacteroidia bacterium]|nr:hypothetical protein [Bacteroidia bacterium]
MEEQRLFYSNLGKLFYAIAAADKTVAEAEINTLKQIVNTEWLALDGAKDKTEVDAMRQIKITFEQLNTQKANAKNCMAEFKSFKESHAHLFTYNVKQLIWKTANAIASSFSRKNKSELVLIAELATILKQ